MKRALLFAGMAVAMVACQSSDQKTTKTKSSAITPVDTLTLKSGESYYQCEMHPDVISAMPGSCPQCGMTLTQHARQ